MVKIITFNINGIKTNTKQELLNKFLNLNKPDILALKETNINEFEIDEGHKAMVEYYYLKNKLKNIHKKEEEGKQIRYMGNRYSVSYSGQTKTCFRCDLEGHEAGNCNAGRKSYSQAVGMSSEANSALEQLKNLIEEHEIVRFDIRLNYPVNNEICTIANLTKEKSNGENRRIEKLEENGKLNPDVQYLAGKADRGYVDCKIRKSARQPGLTCIPPVR